MLLSWKKLPQPTLRNFDQWNSKNGRFTIIQVGERFRVYDLEWEIDANRASLKTAKRWALARQHEG